MAQDTITTVDIKTRFPELDSVSDATLQVIIDDTVFCFNKDLWGSLYPRAHCLYVAHIYTDRSSIVDADQPGFSTSVAADSGTLKSKSVDSVSAAYATYEPKDSSEQFMSTTKYGQEFLYLKRKVRYPQITTSAQFLPTGYFI